VEPSELLTLAKKWRDDDVDEVTRAELDALIAAQNLPELADRFRGQLEFGTAGLRGLVGAGPNRMNRAVVIRTTAGLAAYLLEHAKDAKTRGVVIGRDGRFGSPEFTEETAAVLAAAGIPAHVFDTVVPTPLVSFAVRDLGAVAGVMVTASHNPPEYNGYKVYWSNAAQIIPPHDKGIAAAIDRVPSVRAVARLPLEEARAKGLLRAVELRVPEFEASDFKLGSFLCASLPLLEICQFET
jgi:phosphomannomutase